MSARSRTGAIFFWSPMPVQSVQAGHASTSIVPPWAMGPSFRPCGIGRPARAPLAQISWVRRTLHVVATRDARRAARRLRPWLAPARSAESTGTVYARRVFCRRRQNQSHRLQEASKLREEAQMQSPAYSVARLAAGIGVAGLVATALAIEVGAQQPQRPTSGPGANPLDKSEQLLAKTKQDKNLKPHATPLTVTPPEKIP